LTTISLAMKALVLDEHGDLRLRTDYPRPAPAAGEVVVTVDACGVCGTDLAIIAGVQRSCPPVVLGHEYIGKIVAVGDGVTEWRVGDRVVCEQHAGACGDCPSCLSGDIHWCEAKRAPGVCADGAFAEQVLLPQHLLHRVSPSVDRLIGCLAEPLAVILTGLDRVTPQPKDAALVIGPGSLGVLTALVLQDMGVRTTLAGRSTSSMRLAAAGALGLDVVDLRDVGTTADGTGGQASAYDLVVDTTGNASVANTGLARLRRGGRFLELGLCHDNAELDLRIAIDRAATIVCSLSSERSTWERALALIAEDRLPLQQFITPYSLDDWQLALRDVAGRRVLKAVLVPLNDLHDSHLERTYVGAQYRA
jgi:L-iditol 2-dehydrogenase